MWRLNTLVRANLWPFLVKILSVFGCRSISASVRPSLRAETNATSLLYEEWAECCGTQFFKTDTCSVFYVRVLRPRPRPRKCLIVFVAALRFRSLLAILLCPLSARQATPRECRSVSHRVMDWPRRNSASSLYTKHAALLLKGYNAHYTNLLFFRFYTVDQ